jgi:hypothetical protein
MLDTDCVPWEVRTDALIAIQMKRHMSQYCAILTSAADTGACEFHGQAASPSARKPPMCIK